MAIQTKDYSHKAHKCMGTTGYKIAIEDMTLADLEVINNHIETRILGNLHMTEHVCEEMVEYGIFCGCHDIEKLLVDTMNLVEIQKHPKFDTPAFLFRANVSTIFSLCVLVSSKGDVITLYGNRIEQQHKNKNKKLYRKGVPIAQLLH